MTSSRGSVLSEDRRSHRAFPGCEPAGSVALTDLSDTCLAAFAVSAAMAGDRGRATGYLRILRERGLADAPMSGSWLATMHGVVEAAWLIDDAGTARIAYTLLKPYADSPCSGLSVQHALGVAALTVGNADRAVTHLAAAVDQHLAVEDWSAVVGSRLILAQALSRRARPGDAVAADREFAAAAREATASSLIADSVSAASAVATCIREGRRWRIGLGNRSARVDHTIGMFHLAVLIANPGREVPAVELAAGVAALGGPSRPSSTQDVLDPEAVRGYRRRLADLSEQIGRWESAASPDRFTARITQARAEHAWLVTELAQASGFSGRTRRFATDDERARIAVGKAIRRAISHVNDADSTIGGHLAVHVHTGLRCYYYP